MDQSHESAGAPQNVDVFEFTKRAIIGKKEELEKLLAERDIKVVKRAEEMIPKCFEEVVNLVRVSVKLCEMDCEVRAIEAPYGDDCEEHRARVLALKAVMAKLQAEPYNCTIYEKSSDNILKIWQRSRKVRDIRVEHSWIISCLLVNI